MLVLFQNTWALSNVVMVPVPTNRLRTLTPNPKPILIAMKKVLLFRLLLLFPLIVLSACNPAEPLIYDPMNWTPVRDEAQVWKSVVDGAEIHVFRQTVQDQQAHSFRLHFELFNKTKSVLTLPATAKLASGDALIDGQIIRLFSPEGLTISAGEYTEFAAVFDLAQSAEETLTESLKITFTLLGDNLVEMQFNLTLGQVKP